MTAKKNSAVSPAAIDRTPPRGWRWVPLADVAQVVGGSTPKSSVAEYWNGSVVWITPTDLGNLTTRSITGSARSLSHAGYRSCATRLLPVGTVVMSSRAPIGHLGIAGLPLCTNQGCKSFIPSSEVDPTFLYWSLRYSIPAIRALGSGNTFQEVSKTALERFPIAIPALCEQRRIAAALDRQMATVERARAAAETKYGAIEAYESAAIRHAFGVRPLTLDSDPETPRGWRWHLLTEVARLESGHTPSRRHPEWWGGDVPWIALPDIRALDGQTATNTLEKTNEAGLANSSARLLPEGTVVLSRTASVGFVAVMGRPMATSQDFVNWICGPQLLPWFLAYAVIASRSFLMSLASGAIHKTIYVPTVKALRICLPSLTEQRRITADVKAVRLSALKARTAIEAQLNAINSLPAALLGAAFQGEI